MRFSTAVVFSVLFIATPAFSAPIPEPAPVPEPKFSFKSFAKGAFKVAKFAAPLILRRENDETGVVRREAFDDAALLERDLGEGEEVFERGFEGDEIEVFERDSQDLDFLD